jgi:hypothetical protein
MSMKQNEAVVLTALHGDLTKISRKDEYFAQLCGRHLSVPLTSVPVESL